MTAGKDILRNFNIFIDGIGQFGRAKTIEPPKLKLKMEEYRGAGMDTPIEIDLGTEKLEANLTMHAMSREYYASFGLGPGKNIPVTARGAVVGEDGTKTSIILHMRGKIAEIDEGTWETGKLNEVKMRLALIFYKRIHNRAVVLQIEADSGARIVGGVDQNAWIRDALAIAAS